MAGEDYDSILLHVTSDDAQRPFSGDLSTCNFNISLNNAPSRLSRLHGYSVEAVSFTNFLPNIRDDEPGLIIDDGPEFDIAEGFYNIENFAAALDTISPDLEFKVQVGAGADGGDLLRIEKIGGLDDTVISPAYNGVAYAAGIVDQPVVLSLGDATVRRTNLNGPNAVLLKESLASSTGIGSDAIPDNSTILIPITEPYGSIQTWVNDAAERPIVLFRDHSASSVYSINFKLTYMDGAVCNLGNSKVSIAIRLYTHPLLDAHV
jgi:hypothetical protein